VSIAINVSLLQLVENSAKKGNHLIIIAIILTIFFRYDERREAGSEEAGVESQVQPLEANKAVVDVEQEREAILRMIAEGRLTPDEGDMLLEALS
jgi:SHOCT-like protein